MRILWTMLKIVVGLAVAIPLGVLALALTLGVLGALVGLAIVALKLACVVLAAYVALRVVRRVLGHSAERRTPPARELPSPDPYYRAAMRELDAELGHSAR